MPEQAAQAAKPQSPFSFSVNQSYSEETPFSATGGTGRINFAGSILTGTPCYNVTGASGTSPCIAPMGSPVWRNSLS